jgi:hydroxymethylbilane synthase
MTEPALGLRLGTRASALAIRQAEWVSAELTARFPGLRPEITRIKTSGDRIPGRSLADIGGKGLFIKEIEEALRDGRIDVGVHSMKDLPATLAPGLGIAAVPRREDARDVLIARSSTGLAGLAPGARVGTSSLRRGAFLRHVRSDLIVVAMRGNVDTRIARWRAGEVDAIVLAGAGLRRLGLAVSEAHTLSTEEMLPAIGQGALAIEARPDGRGWALAGALEDPDARDAVSAERAFLAGMGGDCTTPIAAHATLSDGTLRLEAAIGDPEGRRLIRGSRSGARADGEAIGRSLADELLASGGREILRGLGR